MTETNEFALDENVISEETNDDVTFPTVEETTDTETNEVTDDLAMAETEERLTEMGSWEFATPEYTTQDATIMENESTQIAITEDFDDSENQEVTTELFKTSEEDTTFIYDESWDTTYSDVIIDGETTAIMFESASEEFDNRQDTQN